VQTIRETETIAAIRVLLHRDQNFDSSDYQIYPNGNTLTDLMGIKDMPLIKDSSISLV
jgi:hypothetical protein